MGVKMVGKEVDSGIYFKVDTYVLYDLKGQYREVTFTAGVSDEYNDGRYPTLLHFYIDGVNCMHRGYPTRLRSPTEEA